MKMKPFTCDKCIQNIWFLIFAKKEIRDQISKAVINFR